MISNVPDHHELRSLAVRAYFVAWKEASSLFESIEHTGVIRFEVRDEKLVPVAGPDNEPTLQESRENLSKYEKIMQPRLQLIYSLIQHSQELALKSYICEESPFLLLLGSDVKTWTRENVDFMDCKTIDASDLVKVVTAIGNRAGPGYLDSSPRILSGSLPGFAERGAFRFCRGVGRA